MIPVFMGRIVALIVQSAPLSIVRGKEFPRLEVSCAPTTTMTTNRHVHHQHHYPNCSDEVFVPPPALPAFVCGSGWRKGEV
jgi:hypothetical protein